MLFKRNTGTEEKGERAPQGIFTESPAACLPLGG